MTTIYIVSEKLSEYNDEVYVFHEGNQGKPIKAYTNREPAEELCFTLNWQWLLDNADPEKNEYCQYEYRFEDMFFGKAWDYLQDYELTHESDLIRFSAKCTDCIPMDVKKYIAEHSIAPYLVMECTLYG
jgi:hypothetical protein